MRRSLTLGLLLGALPLVGCPERPVCDPNPSSNTCGGDGDCVLGYCATECCWCPRAYARSQIDATWCLTESGGTPPIVECMEGRDTRCAGGLPCVCAYDVEPWCNAGKCDLRSTTP